MRAPIEAGGAGGSPLDTRGQGDGVLEALFVSERQRLQRICRGLLDDERDAEDAVQEAFLRAAPRLHTAADPTAYLVVTARNVCFEELRRRRVRNDARPLAAVATAPDPEASAIEKHDVARALESISRSDRAMLEAAASGFSLTETARRLGLSVDATAQRLSRARRRARQAFVSLPVAVLAPRMSTLRAWVAVRRAGMGESGGAWVARLQQVEGATAPLVVAVIAGAAAMAPVVAPPSPHATQMRAPVASPRDPAAAQVAGRDQGGAAAGARVGAAAGAPSAARASTPPPASRSGAGGPGLVASASTTSFTPSPSYSSDHTVYATTAPSVSPCPTTTCATLLRSTDSGRTWTAAGSYGGGPLLLPPSFPQVPVMFAVNSGGLEESDDRGSSFRRVVPLSVTPGTGFVPQAVVDAASPASAPRVVVTASATSLVTYDTSRGSAAAGPVLPATVQRIDALLAAPGGGVYVDAESLDGGGMYLCSTSASASCQRVGPWVAGSPILSPTFTADHTILSAPGGGVTVARIDGGGAHTLALDDAVVRLLPAPDYATSGRLGVLSLHQLSDGSSRLRMLESVGGGALQPSAAQPTAVPLNGASLTLLPDGELIAGLAAHSGPDGPYGIAWSADGGRTWSRAS